MRTTNIEGRRRDGFLDQTILHLCVPHSLPFTLPWPHFSFLFLLPRAPLSTLAAFSSPSKAFILLSIHPIHSIRCRPSARDWILYIGEKRRPTIKAADWKEKGRKCFEWMCAPREENIQLKVEGRELEGKNSGWIEVKYKEREEKK